MATYLGNVMIQVQEKIEGQLTACPGKDCGRQPKHWVVRGKNLHMLECTPCGNRTPKFSTFNEAVAAWESQAVEVIR